MAKTISQMQKENSFLLSWWKDTIAIADILELDVPQKEKIITRSGELKEITILDFIQSKVILRSQDLLEQIEADSKLPYKEQSLPFPSE